MSTASRAESPITPESTPLERFVAKYKRDHQHPVNHFLHVGAGWPLCALGVILLPFRPLWGVGLFLLGYALMFAGHFLFEKNTPTVLKHPSTPFVIAWAVIRDLGRIALRVATLGRVR
jgi:hypothetical protein